MEEELPADQLPALVTLLESMDLKTHGFHTDYYWSGQFGLELTLKDGTYLVYDGTRLYHRDTPVSEGWGSDYELSSQFIEVTNMEFWEEIKPFFSTIDGVLGSW